MAGPLQGLKIVELAGIGPVPFAGMLLSDMGADVVRVDRPADVRADHDRPEMYVLNRGRRSVAVDLKHPDGVDVVLRLVDRADALIEGFRPGVTERLGLGPDVCLARNPRLVYGRMTGWGQDGPYALTAGHDIDYLALTGILAAIGRPGEPPPPPLNVVADFGGGAMFLAFGVLAGIVEASRSGRGQVVDAAMVDGAALLASMIYGMVARGTWTLARGSNGLDSGAPYYDTYECADGRYIAVGAIEPAFYRELVVRMTAACADDHDLPLELDRTDWPGVKPRFAAAFRTKTRDEWCALLEGSDACFAPVMTFAEAPGHPHNVARGTFIEHAGVVQPAPSPRFSRTPGAPAGPPCLPGQHTLAALAEWGITRDELDSLVDCGAVRQHRTNSP